MKFGICQKKTSADEFTLNTFGTTFKVGTINEQAV
ncbi:MAG: hypothetical protein RL632_2282 [Bacteroidota bacterium]